MFRLEGPKVSGTLTLLEGEFIEKRFVRTTTCSAMDRFASVNCCLGLLGLLLLQGALIAEGRSIFNSGNHILNLKDDTGTESKILALLLHKGFAPHQRNDALGLELSNKIAELEELQALRENLEMDSDIRANVLADDKSLPKKRGEPCFWKYCV